MIEVHIASEDLQKALNDIGRYKDHVKAGVRGEIERTSWAVTNKAMVNLYTNKSVKTGRLRASMPKYAARFKDLLRFRARAGSDVEYAAPVEFGSAPHVIRAKNQKFLHFKTSSGWVKKESVNHPGNRAKPYLFPAVESERNTFNNNILKILGSKR